MVKWLQARVPGFKHQFAQLPVLWPWENYLTSLGRVRLSDTYVEAVVVELQLCGDFFLINKNYLITMRVQLRFCFMVSKVLNQSRRKVR